MLSRIALVLYFAVGLALLALRYLLLPHADAFRGQIADSLSQALGMPVSIGHVDAAWSGLRPTLALTDLRIEDGAGRPALALARVEATLSWGSLPRGQPVFRSLLIRAPRLDLRREADGRLFAAGVEIGGGGGGGFGGWLAAQPEIVVRDARVVWSDALRGGPPLELSEVDLRLLNGGSQLRFGLTATLPEALGGPIDLRGELAGDDLGDPARWRGRVYAHVERAELAGWQAWVNLPVPLAGRGEVDLWFDLAAPKQYRMQADLVLRDARARLREDLPELVLERVEGRVLGSSEPTGWHLSVRDLSLAGEGAAMHHLDLDLDRGADPEGERGHFRTPRLDIGVLAMLASHLPLEPAVLAGIESRAPTGRVFDLDFAWAGPVGEPRSWTFKGRVEDLRLAAGAGWPGVLGLAGQFEGDQAQGRFELSGAGTVLDLPMVFPDPRLPLDRLQANGSWHTDGGLEVRLERAVFENADAVGSAAGRYRPSPRGDGVIDLEATLSRAEPNRVWRYLPRVVGDATRNWLRSALVGGRALDARLRLVGDLDKFPFPGGRDGQFLVTLRVEGVGLEYASGWPAITDIDGELRFEGQRMDIRADRGRIGDTLIGTTRVDIPALGNHDEILNVHGSASGNTAGFLQFIADSPVSGNINHFTDGFRAGGSGELTLALRLPLQRMHDSQVEGEFRFSDNSLRLFDALPELQAASARIGFTEAGLTIADGRARLLGEPVAVRGATRADGTLEIQAGGTASAEALARAAGVAPVAWLAGRTGWSAEIQVQGTGAEVKVKSPLYGLSSSLPSPLAKPGDVPWPLELSFEARDGGDRQRWSLALGPDLQARMERKREGGQGWTLERAGVAYGAPLRIADRSVALSVTAPDLDIDAWRALAGGGGDGQRLSSVYLRTGRLKAYGEEFSDLELMASADPGGWRGRLSSPAVAGEFDWRSGGEGALMASFSQLHLGSRRPEPSAEGIREVAESSPSSLPALNVTASDFRLRERRLGALALQARNLGGAWELESLRLANPDGVIEGSGRWRPGQRTDLTFQASVEDVGAYLGQIGYPDVIMRGTAALSGQLGWQGPPTEVDYPSLGGKIDLAAGDGQFRKLEPGVGRLLGVLSLQALPRRVTLDFRDVFSEGFAFDRIEGNMTVSGGVMNTDELMIRGPAARIRLSGSVDLAAEAQDLRVGVQPTLTESVAVGAALANSATGLINPVAGLVTYLAQKIMQDPIERLFAYQYSVTGPWDDPKVEKLTAAPPAVQPAPAPGLVP